jgi:cytochrome P450
MEIDIVGYKIPKDIELAFAVYAVHREPEFWTDPERFDPER